jgi:hypothetical protein
LLAGRRDNHREDDAGVGLAVLDVAAALGDKREALAFEGLGDLRCEE